MRSHMLVGVVVALGQMRLSIAARNEDAGMGWGVGEEEEGRVRITPVRRSDMKVVVRRWMVILVIQIWSWRGIAGGMSVRQVPGPGQG